MIGPTSVSKPRDHTSLVRNPLSSLLLSSSFSISLSTISMPERLGNRLLKSAIMSGLAWISRVGNDDDFGGDICVPSDRGPVLMLLRCMGFGGALGRGPPVLETVAGEDIGGCARGIELVSPCVGTVPERIIPPVKTGFRPMIDFA